MKPATGKRGRARRDQILDSALIEFAGAGFDGASMRRIAERVGITEPALYRHFPGKRALFGELVSASCDDIAARIRHVTRMASLKKRTSPRRAAEALFDTGCLGSPDVLPLARILMWRALAEDLELGPLGEALDEFRETLDSACGVRRTKDGRQEATRLLLTLTLGYWMSAASGHAPGERIMSECACSALGWSGKRDAQAQSG